MGCGCGGSGAKRQAGSQTAKPTARQKNGPSNPQGSYYWTGPKRKSKPAPEGN